MNKMCQPVAVQQQKSLKSKQKTAKKSTQKARKEVHNQFYEDDEDEVPPLPPPLPIMQLMYATTSTGHQVMPTIPPAPVPTTSHQVIPTIPPAPVPTTSHQVIPTLPPAPVPNIRHQIIPTVPPAPVPMTSHQVIPTLPPVPVSTISHQVIPTPAPVPSTSHHVEPPPLFADLLDDGLLDVLGSADQSNGGINEEQSLADLKSEASDIKARLAHLEEILCAENSCSSNRNMNDSATVQLILANKTMGWKVALRKLLQLKFGVNMLGNSCAKGRKGAKFDKLDDTKMLEIKGAY